MRAGQQPSVEGDHGGERIAITSTASLTSVDAATLPRTRALLRVARRLLLVVGLMVGFLLLGFATGVANADSNPVEKVSSAAEKTVTSVTGSSKSDSAKSISCDHVSPQPISAGLVLQPRILAPGLRMATLPWFCGPV